MTQRKRRYFLMLAALCLPLLSMAAKSLDQWTLEEVLQAVVDANGGDEALAKVTNGRFKGEIIGKENYDFLLLKRRPNMMRSRMMNKTRAIETGFDGTTAWRRLEFKGHDKVEVLTDPDVLQALALEADFDGILIGPAPEGITRRLVGVERIGRIDYFLVEVTSANWTRTHYIDSRTFRELKTIQVRTGPEGKETVIETQFHDNQKHMGAWIAHRVERVFENGDTETILINEVELNPGILSFSFRIPEERNPIPGS